MSTSGIINAPLSRGKVKEKEEKQKGKRHL